MVEFFKQNYWSILFIFNYLIAVSAAIVVLLKNLNPTKTISYILVLIVFPFLGLLVYYLFGQEYRKNKIFSRKNILNQDVVKSINQDLKLDKQDIRKVDNRLNNRIKLVKLLYSSEQSPLTLKNDIEILKSGNDKFSRLIEDIKTAKHHIHLEYFILKDDTIGSEILNLLCDKSNAGVEVRISYDDVGSKITSQMKNKLHESGVQHYPFMPVLFSRFTGKMNYRNHRKIAVIDGLTGYVGGVNIADDYVNSENSHWFWRDTHLRITGEAVKSLQIYFLTTWDFVSGKNLKVNKRYFPKVECENDLALQIAASGPDTDWANIMEAIFTAIATANNYVYITTPYLIPNDEMLMALAVASKSGVDVRLIIPKESDSILAKHAADSYLNRLLQAGIRVYKYKKGFIHAKTMVVDDIFSSVGTSNMDYRSFNINFEINAFIYDKKNSTTLKKHFLDDLKECEEVDYKTYKNRSQYKKLKESFCRLWSPLI